jgi:ATP-dependent protease ClpP protease subunit
MKGAQLSVFNYSLKNQTDDSVDIHVDGYIVDSPSLEMYKLYWGDETSVSYKSFRDSIPPGVKTINLFVNSGGGHVGDAMAIHDYLTDLEANGTTVNREGRGIVASAATYLVMGKNSRLSDNCLFMIHEVSGFAYGDVSSMENQVKAMRKFNDLIVNFYVNKTGLSATVIGNMMKAETWLNAQEAKEKNFVTSVGPKATISNSIKPEHWQFSNTAMLNTYNSFINSNNVDMDTTKISDAIKNGFESFLDKLGIKNRKDEEVVQNAFKDLSDSITNALKESAPSEEAIGKLVGDAVANAFKGLADNEAFKNAITDATKDVVKKEDIVKEVTNQLTNTVTKKDLTDAMEGLTNSIVEKLGGETDPKNKKEKKEKKENSGTGGRFSNVSWSDSEED